MPENVKRKPDFNRREMPKQEHHIRSHNFLEVALGYTAELAMAEAQRCLAMQETLLRCRLSCADQDP